MSIDIGTDTRISVGPLPRIEQVMFDIRDGADWPLCRNLTPAAAAKLGRALILAAAQAEGRGEAISLAPTEAVQLVGGTSQMTAHPIPDDLAHAMLLMGAKPLGVCKKHEESLPCSVCETGGRA